MRRSFKGKQCAYCATSLAASDDHVFCRELFPPDDRGNLPKVPACKKCNGQKSELERYATCVLPFGSRHPDAVRMMTENVPKRLQNNLHIRRELLKGEGRALAKQPNGLLVPTTTFKVDGSKIDELLRYMVQGLVYHHWGFHLKRDETEIEIRTARTEGDVLIRAMFDGLLGRHKGTALHVRQNLGNGTARYEGIGTRVLDQSLISVWRLQLLDSIYSIPDGPVGGFIITTTPLHNSKA